MTSSDIELNRDWEECDRHQYVGLRFQGVNIDPGTTIVSAVIEFTVDVFDTSQGWQNLVDPLTVTIAGQNSNNAPAYSAGTDFDVSGRTYLGTTVTWSPVEVWTTTPPLTYQSADISSIVQEIVNLPGWASGNAMAFKITGDDSSGQRSANSFEAGSPAKLKIFV